MADNIYSCRGIRPLIKSRERTPARAQVSRVPRGRLVRIVDGIKYGFGESLPGAELHARNYVECAVCLFRAEFSKRPTDRIKQTRTTIRTVQPSNIIVDASDRKHFFFFFLLKSSSNNSGVRQKNECA